MNRATRAKMIARGPVKMVRVLNVGISSQFYGRYELRPGEWQAVPSDLAKRLVGDDGYEVEGLWTPAKALDHSVARGWKMAPAEVKFKAIQHWPSVSIVIPIFNSPTLLQECLKSLTRTDYKGDLTLVLVDNGSTDEKTLAIIRAAKHAVTIRNDKSVGFAAAVNKGMRAVDAEFYVLFNQDCRVRRSDWLTQLIRWMQTRRECAIAGPKLLYPNGTIQEAGIEIPAGTIGRHRFAGMSTNTEEAGYYEKVRAVTGAVLTIRAAAVKGPLGYLDEGFPFSCEDTAYCLRAGCLGYEVWYVPDSVVIHHEGAIRRGTPSRAPQLTRWLTQSEAKFHSEHDSFNELCAEGSAAIVLPTWLPKTEECVSASCLADRLLRAGVETTIYVSEGPVQEERAGLAWLKPLAELRSCSVLIAMTPAGAHAAQGVLSRRRFLMGESKAVGHTTVPIEPLTKAIGQITGAPV